MTQTMAETECQEPLYRPPNGAWILLSRVELVYVLLGNPKEQRKFLQEDRACVKLLYGNTFTINNAGHHWADRFSVEVNEARTKWGRK
jgi:hypothetical protein